VLKLEQTMQNLLLHLQTIFCLTAVHTEGVRTGRFWAEEKRYPADINHSNGLTWHLG